MIKFISSEEYAKLTGNIDYWKARTLQEERMKQIYKEENEKLKSEIERLEELFDDEHKCTRSCFAEHVLPAIQNDYDSIDSKNRVAKYLFINYWYDNLVAFYPWLKRLYSINGKIRFK